MEQPEATTIEFQELFSKVINNAVNNEDLTEQRKIVIVIDNLDRLDKEEAQSIWSLLRGFIDNPTYRRQKTKNNWLSKVWVIIPLANTKRYHVLENDQDNDKDKETKNAIIEDQFLEKIFQVRFHLPPPIQSDWRVFLESLLNKTFPSEGKKQRSLVVRLYENVIFETPFKNKLPTPRELTLFINDLIVLKLQWGEKFDLSYYAAYVLSFGTTKDMLKGLQQGTIPTISVKRILNTDPTKEFATLFFNIPDTEKANTVLLKPVIEQALQTRDPATLVIMLEKSTDLKHMLEAVLDSSFPHWAQGHPEAFFNAILTITDLDGELGSSVKEELQETIMQRMSYALKNVLKTFPFNVENSVEAVIQTAKINTQNDLTETVVESIKLIKNISLEESKLQYPIRARSQWIGNLYKLYESDFFKPAFDKLGTSTLNLPLDYDGWATTCEEYSDKKGFLRIISIPNMESEIKTNLIESIKNSIYSRKDFFVLKRDFENDNYGYFEDNYVEIAELSLASGRADDCNENIIEDILYFRNKSQKFDDLLLNASNKGYLGHLFSEFYRISRPKATNTLLAILLKNPELTQHRGLPASLNGIQQVTNMIQQPASYSSTFKELLTQIEWANLHRVLIDFAINNLSSSSLLQFLIPEVENRELIYKEFDVENLPEELNEYANRVNTNDKETIYREVINLFIDNQEFIDYLLSNAPTSDTVWLYSLVIENKKLKNKKVIQHCVTFLKSLDENAWLENIRSYSWTIKLVLDILNTNTKIDLLIPLRKALLALMRETENEEALISIEKAHMSKLQQSLSDFQRGNFAEDVYEFSAQPTQKLTAAFWKLFGDILEEATISLASSGRPIRRLFMPIFTSQDANGIRWVLNLLKQNKLSAIDSDRNSKNDLKETLSSLMKNLNKDNVLYEDLKEIAELLKLNIA